MSDHPPERRRMAGQFITMDAAMLAAQNERLDQLNENIQALAKSIGERPTKYDLKQARKRSRNQLIATIVVFALVMGGVVYNQKRLDAQCEDRNRNAEAFKALLVTLLANPSQPGSENSPGAIALRKYTDTIKIVNC